MHLKLTHRRYAAGTAQALAVPEAPPGGYDSRSMRRVMERLARRPGQKVLDLGMLNGEAVCALAETGARVYVYDRITPLREQLNVERVQVRSLFKDLKFLPESLDIILGWELFDLLAPKDRIWAVGRMTEWLVPKGLLMALFHDVPCSMVHRFRLAGNGHVLMEDGGPLDKPTRSTTNNDVATLFAGFSLLHSSLVRGQFREILFQRPAR